VLLKIEDSTQEILAATATNPCVYLLNIYFVTCEKNKQSANWEMLKKIEGQAFASLSELDSIFFFQQL